ncbi:ATPase [Aureococcus anophagefferens]|nr:ATPase [Aureococcus anophagefferens]
MSSLNAVATNIMPKALEQLLSEKIAAQNVEVAESFKPVLSYIASLASNSCVAEEFDPVFHLHIWEKTCQAYLEPIMNEAAAKNVTKGFMDDSEKRVPKRGVVLDIPRRGEILCNVEFKLAYGGKILLNTTHFHVRRGRIYGLLGHNGCGKSTLMRAISSGQLAGFPAPRSS